MWVSACSNSDGSLKRYPMLASKSAVLRRRRFFSPDAVFAAPDASRLAFVAGLVWLGAEACSTGASLISLGARPEPCSATIGFAGAPAAASMDASEEARLPVRLGLIVRS